MAGLSLKHIYKVYPNGTKAVNDFNMEIADKEFIVFVGPSGCGKSTTLRMIAGLEDISAGELMIGENVVNDMEPKDRDIAMVFQNYALYPHMTVFDNVAFGLKNFSDKKLTAEEKEAAVRAALGIVGLNYEEIKDKSPFDLSGGQKRRGSRRFRQSRQPHRSRQSRRFRQPHRFHQPRRYHRWEKITETLPRRRRCRRILTLGSIRRIWKAMELRKIYLPRRRKLPKRHPKPNRNLR